MTREARRVGILGLGAIGRPVARALAKGMPGLALAGVTSRDAGRAREFLAGLPGPPPFLEFEELVERSDLVVEAATRAALVELAPTILEAGRDLVILSVGALLDHPEWVDRAAARGARIHAPSAAIAGLDGLKGAAVDGELDTVVMETRKPPRGLAGAPGVAGIDLDAISAPTVVFEGTAREACRAFPANTPDRRNVHSSPDVSISRSMRSAMSLEGLGCWKNGCGVLRGAVRNTMRRACFAIRSSASATEDGGATHTRNTVSIP